MINLKTRTHMKEQGHKLMKGGAGGLNDEGRGATTAPPRPRPECAALVKPKEAAFRKRAGAGAPASMTKAVGKSPPHIKVLIRDQSGARCRKVERD